MTPYNYAGGMQRPPGRARSPIPDRGGGANGDAPGTNRARGGPRDNKDRQSAKKDKQGKDTRHAFAWLLGGPGDGGDDSPESSSSERAVGSHASPNRFGVTRTSIPRCSESSSVCSRSHPEEEGRPSR